MPVTTVTPSRVQREPASLDRIATGRAPSTGTLNEAHQPQQKGALRRTHGLSARADPSVAFCGNCDRGRRPGTRAVLVDQHRIGLLGRQRLFERSSHAGSAKRGLAHSAGPRFGRNRLLLPGCRTRRTSRRMRQPHTSHTPRELARADPRLDAGRRTTSGGGVWAATASAPARARSESLGAGVRRRSR